MKENDILIADFMGGVLMESSRGEGLIELHTPDGMIITGPHDSEIRYDESWEWLMPVIEKIGNIKLPDNTYDSAERIYVKQIYPRTFGMKDEEGKFMFRFNGFQLYSGESLIKIAYDAVIEVINFENKDGKN